jgi:non-ribosomal peptide synthase protein (TIGR01720 family)
MIPPAYVAVPEIPLTRNGKVDTRSLPLPAAAHAGHAPAAPVSRPEEVMLEVWQDVLNNGHAGVDDGFFELGGDSIKAVQIASRLFERHWQVKPKDILLHQTVRRVAPHCREQPPVHQYTQEPLEGEKALSPIEHWFFENGYHQLPYYNQSVLLDLKEEVEPELLRAAFERVIRHHDALRLNHRDNVLCFNGAKKEFELPAFDVSGLGEAEKKTRTTELCGLIRSRTDSRNGDVLHAALIKLRSRYYALFITVHHLAIDGFSWNILLEDLRAAYHTLKAGRTVRLPQKSASLVRWQAELVAGAGRVESDQLAYWQALEDARPAPPPREAYTAERMADQLGAAQTHLLTREVCQVLAVSPVTILLTALARALAGDEGSYASVIELEQHGRATEGADVSRTIGWFTSLYPFRLSVSAADGITQQIRGVAREMAKIPDGGTGYGVLKYLSRKLDRPSGGCALRFNYLGDFDRTLNNDFFALSDLDTGAEKPAGVYTATNLEINAMIIGEVLRIECWYNNAAVTRAQARTLLNRYLAELEMILTDTEQDVLRTKFAPERFETVNLDNDDLDVLFN